MAEPLASLAPSPPSGSDASPFALDVDYSTAPALARLPRGRHGLPREFVEQNHRNRLLAGAIEVAAERGYLAATVTHITTAAEVSRAAFYRQYDDKQDCFLAAYDVAVAWIEAAIARAIDPADGWPQAVKTAVATTLDLFAADPRLARLCTVEIHFAGPPALARYEATVERLAIPLRAGRAERPLGAGLPLHLEPTLVGGAISLIPRYLNAEDGDRLAEAAPELTEFLLAPYLGVGAARRIAQGEA
jgi:AcrR family transcriptional regulator